VVGYNHGGVGEILAATYPDGLVDLGDLDNLAKRITELLEQPVIVANCGAYPLAVMLEKTILLYTGFVNPPIEQ